MIVTLDDAPAGRILRDPAGGVITYASAADGGRSTAAILAGLRRGAPRSRSFHPAGELAVSWDGTTCTTAGPDPTSAGEVLVEFHNASSSSAPLEVAAP